MHQKVRGWTATGAWRKGSEKSLTDTGMSEIERDVDTETAKHVDRDD